MLFKASTAVARTIELLEIASFAIGKVIDA